MSKEITLASGNQLTITVANITLGFKLFQTVIEEVKKNGFNGIELSDEDDLLNIGGILKKNPSILIQAMLELISSEKILNLTLSCGASCIYTKNGIKHKVDMNTFDDEEARPDFLEVMQKICIENVKPFFPKAPIVSKQTNG